MFGFGDAGLVAGFGGFFADHAVDQGGFAYVRDAADEYAQGAVDALPVRNQRAAGGGDFLGGLAFGSIKGQGAGVGPVLQFGQPHAGELGVGKVLFVEQIELGLAA